MNILRTLSEGASITRPNSESLLFSRESLAAYLDQRVAEARSAIDQWNPVDLLTTPPQDVIDWVWGQHTVQMPVLLRTGIEALPAEEGYSQIPDGFEGFQPLPVITRRFVVPIEGDPNVLLYQASQWSMNPPTGTVERLDATRGEVLIRLQGPAAGERTAQQINAALHEYIDRIDHGVNLARPDVEQFLGRLRSVVHSVHDRRARLLRERETEQALGYPVRRRTDASSFAVPVTRKTIRAKPAPSGGRVPYRPEPVLEDSDYEEVLRVLINSRNALERSPSTAKTLGEEAIRDILLVRQLHEGARQLVQVRLRPNQSRHPVGLIRLHWLRRPAELLTISHGANVSLMPERRTIVFR